MGTQKTTSIHIMVGGLAAFAILISVPALAQTKKGSAVIPVAPPPAAGQGDKVDITDLESKYWAPKDTDFSVVQNRTYAKDKKFSVSPQWGRPINDSHSAGNLLAVTANYFWSERMGVQATYIKADLSNNESTDDLAKYGSGVQPDHGKLKSYYGVGYNFVPFYAKMSFWGKKIIYFDMAFTPHIGMTEYEQVIETGGKSKNSFTYGLDISQFYFFSRWLAFRVDLKNQWHAEEVVRYHGNGITTQTGEKVSDKNVHDTMFLIGAMFYF